jgi:hypothetical protein
MSTVIVMLTLMVAEAIAVYYAVLAAVIARGLVCPARRVGRLTCLLIYGPVVVTIYFIALLGSLDAFVSH